MAESWGENDKVVSSGDWGADDPEVKPKGGFGAAAKQAVGAVVKGAGQAIEDFTPDAVGKDNAIKRYGQGVIDANPTAIQGGKDILESPWTAIKEATGNAAGSMGPMLGARALGMGITAAAPLTGPFAPATALAGQAIANVGPFVAAALPSFGGIREDQIKQDPTAQDSPQDKAVAALGAGTVGLIEGKFGPQAAALKMMTKQGRDALAKKFAETTLAKGIGYGALKGAAVEGAEELVQSPVEQLASYQDPRDPENVKETLFSGAMGAIGGGVLGGGMGAAQQVIGKKPADPPPAPENNGADGWTTSPGASDGTPPTEPPPTGPLGAKFTPEWTTEQGAAPAKQPGIDMPREIDTGALAIKPSEAMGLAPTAGPSLANAAILSVDSGIHQAATEAADPYNAPLSALGQELSRTNQRLRQEADALGLDTEGLHGDAARMTDGKSHEDYLMAANDQLRKAMKAAKEIPYDGQRSGSDDPAPSGEAKGPDAQAGETPAGDAGGPVRAGAVRPSTDRVGEHGQRTPGTDGGSLPGAVAISGLPGSLDTKFHKSPEDRISGDAKLVGNLRDSKTSGTEIPQVDIRNSRGSGVPENSLGSTAGELQGASNSSRVDSKSLSDLLGSESIRRHGFGGLNSDQLSLVQRQMLRSTQNREVLKSVVSNIPIDVVNVLRGKQLSPEAFLSNPSVLRDVFSGPDGNSDVAPSAGVFLSFIKALAGPAAIRDSGLNSGDMGGRALKANAALGTNEGGQNSTPSDVIAGTVNVPVPQNESKASQASQAPSAQGSAPAGTAVAPTIDNAAHQAATSPNNALPQPTDGQKKAGNYAKGHVNLNGLDLSIENPAGSERSGTDKGGKAWKNTLKHHYGYIKGTVGNDKDHVDLFVKPETPLDYSGTVFVIDQHHPHNGRFDEHKVMVGFDNEAQAKKAYHANYAKGWKGMKSITPMTFDAFKAWVKDGSKNTPVSKDPSVSTQPQKENQSGTTTYQTQQAEAQRPQEQPAAAGSVAGASNNAVADDVAESIPAAANPKIKAALDKKLGLGGQLAELNAELERQGAVQNADTRAKRDAIRKQIAEQDFPEILKAVDDNIDVAEELNRAFKYAGDEPKAKTIERILKKRGITPEYQKRWGDRLMEGQQDELDAEMMAYEGRNNPVPLPTQVADAFAKQMKSAKTRMKALWTAAKADGLTLAQKLEAQTKVKAAEATLRAMRTSIFDAEDAAVKAVKDNDVQAFSAHEMLFPAAHAEMAKLMAVSDEDVQTIENVLKERMDMGIARPEAQRQAVAEAIAMLGNERAVVMGAISAKVAALPAPAKPANLDDRAAAAREKMKNAAAKIAALASKNTRANWTPEEEQQLLPLVIELFDGALELGAITFQKAVKYVREFLTESIGSEITDAIPFETLQGAYVHTARKYKDQGASTGKEVMQFESLADLQAADDKALEGAGEKADTGTKDVQNDPRANAADDHQLLDEQVPGSDIEDGSGGSLEAGNGLRPTDSQGNGRPEGSGSGRGNGVDGNTQPVLPGTPAEIRPLADGPLSHDQDRPRQLAGENPGNFVITKGLNLGSGTDGQKIEGNLNAIRTLRKIQAEHRYPTRDEQAIMARYVGWGGLKTVFDPNKKDATDRYGKAQRELKQLLNAAEFRAANDSIRNAHFTEEGVVDAMWSVLRYMGFKGGRALEPTVGIGNFIGLQPADMAAGTEWHASELDTVTGQMAAMLYPEANILASTGFQDAPFADGAFDIAPGNPPFGSETITDKSPNRKHLSGMKIHNYIIAKAGMHLRPGGVIPMVVTHRFLDTANPEARDVLAKDFRFLGAFRLPNDAFKKNAGTDVVTDVVFLQKLRPDEARERDASWLDVNGTITVDGQDIRVNRYYQDHPTHILGRSAMDGTMQRGGAAEYTVHSDGRNITEAVAELISSGKFSNMENALAKTNNDQAMAPAMLQQSDLPVGGVLLGDDGKIMRRELDDSYGNAVVNEITPETLWKDQAAEWMALRDAVADIKTAFKGKGVTAEDANEVLALARFLYKTDGTQKSSPTLAEAGVYQLIEDLAKPAKFVWAHDVALVKIAETLGRKQLGEDGYRKLKGMLDLRNRTLRLVMAEQANDPQMEDYRADLNRAYDAFVKAEGFLSDSKNANLMDGDIGAEAGIEATFLPEISAAVAKSSGQPRRKAEATKSDIMRTRVNFPYKEITKAESSSDALFASLVEHGKVDLVYMAKITDKSVREVIEELTAGKNPQLFMDPETGDYQEAERYLSGNVRHKLDIAKERGIKANIQALEDALPPLKTKEQVTPSIRGIWMPENLFSEFLQTIGYRNVKVSAIASQGILSADSDSLTMSDFGIQFRHEKRTPMDMFNSAASGKPIVISYTSNGKTYRDEQGTKEVNALVDRMSKVFNEWAYSDESRVKQIVDAFNERMNTHTPRTYDGVKYLKPVGANPSVVLRRTQKDASWRMMQEIVILMDHVVGAGKTYTLITGIMERRRMGLSRKPMVVVPNHLVTQWARDFYKLYPGAKVLAASPADFAKKNRRRLLARIATGNYDAVIVGHTSIGFMETPADDLTNIINEKLEGLKQALAEARKSGDSKRTLGQIQTRIAKYEERLKALAARTTDDIGIDFKALGVDYLAVDEAHEFKNLEYATSGDRVVGMNDPAGSKKAFDLYSKIRGLQSRGGGIAFATGTPVSNSLVEIYTIMSYLAHDQLVLRGQEHFDSWSGAYAKTETRLEYTATQKLKPRRVLAGLNNLSALRQLYEQFADIITMSDLKRLYTEERIAANERDGTNLRTEFPVPKVKEGGRQLGAGDITPAQQEYMDYLVARMAAIEAKKSDKTYMAIDNTLNVLTDARKMSLDIRIVDPGASRDENGKVARAAASIKEYYDLSDADRGTQLVFCDLSTPAKTAQKDAGRIINETIAKLFDKYEAKSIKTQMNGMSFEKRWNALAAKAEELIEDPDTTEEKRDAITEYMNSIEDPEATMNVADIGFSVYDDMKKVLMESGIPESEIAFIHDYNTPDQKDKLFDRVNKGYVRVLMGSSRKMGAGTNAQERLVALHHMDAPWRPSDVEQREGRIIRQGNMLYERDPEGFDVGIHAYSTNNTSDTVMWQILERKAGGIEQFRKGGLDNLEEEGGDSDQYAEFMATSTGNPVFRLKLEAERRLTELEAEIGGAMIARSNARGFMESFDRNMGREISYLAGATAVEIDSVSYGGLSGTAAEFDEAMKKAESDYLDKFVAYQVKRSAAEVELAKWELEVELLRGEKPTLPTMPSRPTLFTKSVQKESAWARTMALALHEAKVGKSTRISLGEGVYIEIEGEVLSGGNYWKTAILSGGNRYLLETSSADQAEGSVKLAESLTPSSIETKKKNAIQSAKNQIEYLDERKKTDQARAGLSIDESKVKLAREEKKWYEVQVAFAEFEADIQRGKRPNRFIARDRRRALVASAARQLGEVRTMKVNGISYTTTGIYTQSFGGVTEQAFRDKDMLPAAVLVNNIRGDKGAILGTKTDVLEQPESIQFKPVNPSTNPRFTGAPEGNDTDVVFSRGTPFYSELSRQIEAANINTAPVIGWKAMLKGLQSKGVKADEITWSGIEEWLDLQTGKVTKAQVLDYLAANGVQVEEVILGQPDEADIEALLNDEAGEGMTREDAIEYLGNDEGGNPTRYDKYQLPGGENYREVLLTLPEKQNVRKRVLRKEGDGRRPWRIYIEGEEQHQNSFTTEEAAREDLAKYPTFSEKAGGQAYQSNHWDQKNVLAHIRVNDRTDADGKKVLMVEEIQSDFGQQAKKEGFAFGDKDKARLEEVEKQLALARTAGEKYEVAEFNSASGAPEYWVVKGSGRNRVHLHQFSVKQVADAKAYELNRDDSAPDTKALYAERDSLENRKAQKRGVPLAPFVDKTDKWLALSLKRIVKMAVDGGYDKVAFVNGEQSAERYDLSKQVDSIFWYKDADSGLYSLDVYRNDKIVTAKSRLDGNGIADFVGKDISEKITSSSDDGGELSGLDLKVGGEGMKTFYDAIVPSATKALLKKLGGGQMESVTIPVTEFTTVEREMNRMRAERGDKPLKGKSATQTGFTITPTMQEKASGGLPLFAKNTTQFSPAAQAQSIEAVERVANAIADAWENGPRIVVAFDMQDARIPERIRLEDQKQRSGGAQGAPEGFYYDGTAYLMASQLKTPNDTARVLFHEALGHFGLRRAFGGALKPILQQIVTMRRAQVDAKVKEYGLRGVSNLDLLTAAEEVLAEMAQTTPEIGFVKRAIAAIRTWLRSNVPGFKNLALTDDEIIRSYILPARGWVERGPGGGGGPRGGLAFSRAKASDQTTTAAFKAWFGGSKVVDDQGKPLVMYHGSNYDIRSFNPNEEGLIFTTPNPIEADGFTGARGGGTNNDGVVYPVFVKAVKPFDYENKAHVDALMRKLPYGSGVRRDRIERGFFGDIEGGNNVLPTIKRLGFDGLYVFENAKNLAVFRPEQIKSAIGNNGDFDPGNDDIRFSRATTARDLTKKATEAVRVFTNTPGKVNWWHKTIGTQYNLAQRSPQFKRVYDAVQDFIGDVSFYATEAADLAPKILPKLDTWRDIAKSPVSGEDTRAIAAPIFEGTLIWARDESGRPVKVKQLEDEAALMSSDKKAQRLLRNDKISEGVLKMWRGLPMEQYEALIDGKYEKEMLKGGLVWSDAELKSMFNLTGEKGPDGKWTGQIGLYHEFRASTDKSLTNLAISDMLYFGGKDVAPIKEAVLDAKTVDEAAEMLRDYLLGLADLDPENSESLIATANKMIDKGDRVNDLMARGYAPLSRFGTYTLDVVDASGERVYFGLFESRFEADRMAKQMAAEYPGSTVEQGTLSEESYKLFAGVSPETVALFGDMLGLEDNGAYQDYLKLAKSTRSAMKRLIERKGIAGFSEDAGRVLAGFVYSNARQTSQNLHTGEMVQAANDIPKGMGELKDKATKLVEYIKHPQEEAQKVRGLLFAQYIGGSIASAMVNMTQPLTMTLPWLTQFGGLSKASRQMAAAVKDATRKTTGDKALDAALKRGEEDGTVSPQEVHDLMRQAQGKGALKSGDGTKLGNAAATAQNVVSRIGFGWGKLFSTAEQFNRRATFIAAYRTAVEQGMKNPDAFARRAIHETQGVYNKGNKPDWARGAVGSTLFTFKQYSIAYVEMLHRMATTGEPGSPERAAGRRGALYALAVLMLLSGLGGMPGADDLDDIISGLMQSLGYNFDSKAKRKAFLAEYLGDGAAQFMERGVSGLAGVPIDISGRMGLGNLIPATGLLTKKADHTSDVAELLGPAGDMAKRAFQAGGKLIDGDVLGNHGAIATAAPKAVQNLFQAADMADKGMYRDQTGKKVMETGPGDALAKALGFQPNDVKRQQDATWEVKRMVDLNRITETEIADRWAIGLFEKDMEKVQGARDDLAKWNADNPESPIRIKFPQILQRVRAMNQTKAERIAKTAPRELKAQVREALSQQ